MRRDRVLAFVCMFVSGAAAATIPLACTEAAAAPTTVEPIEAIAPAFEDIQRGVACYSRGIATLSCVKVR